MSHYALGVDDIYRPVCVKDESHNRLCPPITPTCRRAGKKMMKRSFMSAGCGGADSTFTSSYLL